MTLALTASQLLTAGAAFVINLLSSAVLDPSERGILALLLQITYLVAVAATIGIESPFIAHSGARYDRALTDYVRTMSPGLLILALPVSAAIITLLQGQTAWAIIWMALAAYVALNAWGKGIRVAAISGSAWVPLLVYTGVTQLVMVAAALVLAASRVDDASTWYFWYVGSGAVVLACMLVSRSRARSAAPLPKDERRVVRRQGMRLLPAAFGNTVMLRSDRLLLPAIAGMEALGIYVVIATVMELATWPIKQWVDASLRTWRMQQSGLGLRWLVRLGVKVMLAAALMTVVLGVFAAIIVVIWLPPAYHASLELIIPLGVAAVVYSAGRVIAGVLIARGREFTVSAIEISGMVISVVGYVALIPWLGALGAALGSVGGYTAALVIGIIVIARQSRAGGER